MYTKLPSWIIATCGVSSLISTLAGTLSIYLQLSNYRKPFEQRLIVRILLIVPMFSITCYLTLINYKIGEIIEPLREIYEAFVIYTFYKLLVLILGGERTIIQTCIDRPSTRHPFPNNLILKPINISDPSDFLMIKRCILQYVWIKPLLLSAIIISSIFGYYDVNDVSWGSLYVWINILYNITVTVSLYNLAMFWKCLYGDLKKFNPWGKFLCVKLIIFASYWQGLVIGLLNWIGLFDDGNGDGDEITQSGTNLGLEIQNALLCVEMIFFAILHWISFPYTDFTPDKILDSGRFKTIIALKDWLFVGDLIYDLKMTTLYGDTYNFRNFDSINDNQIYSDSTTFNQKIYNGLRYSSNGKKYWLPDPNIQKMSHNRAGSSSSSNKSIYNHHQSNPNTPLLSSSSSSSNQKPMYIDSLIGVNDDDDGDDIIVSDGDSITESINSILDDVELNSSNENYSKDEKLYKFVKKHFISDEKLNYPIEYDYRSIIYSNKIVSMRKQLMEQRQNTDESVGTSNNVKLTKKEGKKKKKKSSQQFKSITTIEEGDESNEI